MNYKEIERLEQQVRTKSRGRDDSWVRQEVLRRIRSRDAFWVKHWRTAVSSALFLCFVTIVFLIYSGFHNN
jgi:hypothetical protein